MANNAVLSDVNITTDRSCRDDTLGLNSHIVSNIHLDILNMAVFLAKCWPDYYILFDNNIRAQVDWSHVASHNHLRVHDIFALHSDIFETLQDDVLTDFVLLLREQIELRFVVLGHRLHISLISIY